MYNWVKWLRLLGDTSYIAATTIKYPKAACQVAADNIFFLRILLFYYPMGIYFTN